MRCWMTPRTMIWAAAVVVAVAWPVVAVAELVGARARSPVLAGLVCATVLVGVAALLRALWLRVRRLLAPEPQAIHQDDMATLRRLERRLRS